MTLVYPKDDFEAYLTAVFETWRHRAPEWAIVPESSDWFGPEGPRRSVSPDPGAARRIAAGIETKAGAEAWLVLGQAFRHRDGGKEALLAEFVRLCVRHGADTLKREADPEVRETLRRARGVKAEAHRWLGLIRFQSMPGDGWYARYEPDHDVTGMLVGAFHRRMGTHSWMLHDAGRQKAWISRGGVGEGVKGIRLEGAPGEELREAEVRGLWRQYFASIAIEGRTNPDLQRSKMPRKTWKSLVETPGPVSTR